MHILAQKFCLSNLRIRNYECYHISDSAVHRKYTRMYIRMYDNLIIEFMGKGLGLCTGLQIGY